MRVALGDFKTDWCNSWGSLSDPASAGLSMLLCLPNDVANVYTKAQYGTLPTVSQLPTPPVANAPQTKAEMEGAWSVVQSSTTPEQWASWGQSQRDALTAAVASGDWNPEGNLPFSAQGFSDFLNNMQHPFQSYGWIVYLVIGIGAFALLKR